MNKPNKTQEMVREVRKKAEQALQYCDEVEQGKITAEEFEKRLSKSQWIIGGGAEVATYRPESLTENV